MLSLIQNIVLDSSWRRLYKNRLQEGEKKYQSQRKDTLDWFDRAKDMLQLRLELNLMGDPLRRYRVCLFE